MGVLKIPLLGGPWDGSHANVVKGHIPPDPYKVEVRVSRLVHLYKLTSKNKDGNMIFEYHYVKAEKLPDD